MGAVGKKKRTIPIWLKLTLLAVLILVIYKGCVDKPELDPVAIAEAETEMWQAYYAGNRASLAWELIQVQRNQFGLSYYDSTMIGYDLAIAAARFRVSTGDYETIALPPLTKAYTKIKESIGGDFAPEEAAKAELAWWVARRTSGDNGSEQVGEKIAHLYELLYGDDRPGFYKAGLIRAEAAALRDQGGADADWERIEKMLVQSYKILVQSLPEDYQFGK